MSTPGSTNAVTAVTEAELGSSPVLLIAMNNYVDELDRDLGAFHQLNDVAGLFRTRAASVTRTHDPR